MVLIVFARRRGYCLACASCLFTFLSTKKPGTRSCGLRADHVALSLLGYFFVFFLLGSLFIAPTALLSRFRSDFDLSRFDSPLFIACSPSAPWNIFPLGGQSCAEPAKTLSTVFYDVSDSVPVLRDNRLRVSKRF